MFENSIFFHIEDSEGKVWISNFPDDISYSSIINENCQSVICERTGLLRRQIKISLELVILKFCSYNKDVTNKIFKHYCDAFTLTVPSIIHNMKDEIKREVQKTRRLKHNLVTHSSKIQQELYRLIPQDHFIKTKKNQLEFIKETLSRKEPLIPPTFLRILKNVNFMKAEFDVYDMLNSSSPFLDFQDHLIHKIIYLSYTPFFLDFLEKNITVVIDNCEKNLMLDYKSLSVALCHIFDNAVKYCASSTDINVNFTADKDFFYIKFSMISLKIEDAEREKIFMDGYSGEWSKKGELSGTGIGMYVVKKLLFLNKFEIDFLIDSHSTLYYLDGLPYEGNTLVFKRKL